MVGDNRTIARNTTFLYIRMGLVLIVSLFTTRVVLKVLGEVDYGIYNVVCGLVAIFNVLNVTLSSGINRFYNFELGKKNNSGIKAIYNASIRIQVVLTFIIILLVEVLGSWYLKTKMVIPHDRACTAFWIFHLSIFSLAFSVMEAPYSAAILAYERMDYYAFVSIVYVILKLVMVSLMLHATGDRLLLYGILMALLSVLNFLMYFVYCKARLKELVIEKKVDKEIIKKMTSFSGWMLLDPVAYTVRGQGCNMALNYYFGPIINAAYGIANQVAGALDQFTNAVSTAFRPQILQSYSSASFDRSEKLVFSMSKINFALELMLSIPLIIYMDFVLRLWLDDYPIQTASFASYILIIKTINTLNSPISTLIMASGKVKWYMIVSCGIVSSILPLSIFAFHYGFSPISVFRIMLGLTIINQISSIAILRKSIPSFRIKCYVSEVIVSCALHTLLVCGIMYSLSICLNQTLYGLLFCSLLSVVVSFGSMYLVVLSTEEKTYIKEEVHKILSR